MTNQGDFTAGGVLQASDLNSFSQVTILRQTDDIPNNTNTTIDFTGGELVDVGAWYSSGTTLTVDITGVYLFTANAINLNSSSGRGLLNLFTGSTYALAVLVWAVCA